MHRCRPPRTSFACYLRLVCSRPRTTNKQAGELGAFHFLSPLIRASNALVRCCDASSGEEHRVTAAVQCGGCNCRFHRCRLSVIRNRTSSLREALKKKRDPNRQKRSDVLMNTQPSLHAHTTLRTASPTLMCSGI